MPDTAARTVCDCGSTKHVVGKGIQFCNHCDAGTDCIRRSCAQCRTYDNSVSRRLSR